LDYKYKNSQKHKSNNNLNLILTHFLSAFFKVTKAKKKLRVLSPIIQKNTILYIFWKISEIFKLNFFKNNDSKNFSFSQKIQLISDSLQKQKITSNHK
jgi:hypothetical protein